MRTFFLLLSTTLFLTSCGSESTRNASAKATTNLPDSGKPASQSKDTAAIPAMPVVKQKLALTTDALQLVNANTGSTREMAFGLPYEQVVSVITRTLETEPAYVGINTECGAGPLKMVSWSNGLTLVFQESKRDHGDWKFAGWFAGKPQHAEARLTTMAGVGVGSTLADLQSAYVATVSKTTLGEEFTVKQGFSGLLSGPGDRATIDAMWSGVSCNFR